MGRLKHTQEGMLMLAVATTREALSSPTMEASPGALIRAAKEEMRHTNNYLMDLENWLLEHRWPPMSEGTPARSTDVLWMKKPHPQGPQRYEDPDWAELVYESLREEDGRVTWDVYTAWCEGGGGDEWFVQE